MKFVAVFLACVVSILTGCRGSPTEPEVDNPYNVQCQMWYDPSVGRVCNLTWNQYDGNDFLAYIVVFEETSTGWLTTEEPIMDITTTQCYSLPDVYEGHVPDIMYFRILSWDGIVEEVEFSLIQAQLNRLYLLIERSIHHILSHRCKALETR